MFESWLNYWCLGFSVSESRWSAEGHSLRHHVFLLLKWILEELISGGYLLAILADSGQVDRKATSGAVHLGLCSEITSLVSSTWGMQWMNLCKKAISYWGVSRHRWWWRLCIKGGWGNLLGVLWLISGSSALRKVGSLRDIKSSHKICGHSKMFFSPPSFLLLFLLALSLPFFLLLPLPSWNEAIRYLEITA